MYFQRNLKQDFSITGFIPAIICLCIGALIWVLISPKVSLISVSLFFILYAGFSLWIFSRTRNQGYLAASLWQLMFGFFLATNTRFKIIPGIDFVISGLIVVFLIAATVWLFYLLFNRRAKWKGREIFELASMSTEPLPDGFTERPHPSGKAVYTKSELTGFVRFLSSNLIAMPYFEENRIIVVPVKMDDEFAYLFNPQKFRQNRSWIAFDFEGNVTVNISRRDYLDFKEEVSFDQLCENLGKLFIRFIGYYRKGEGERILYDLNELRLGLTY
jgi:hypothetical protein